ncbi:6159_t:CDS:2, partial [Rhizophagus irregularis]
NTQRKGIDIQDDKPKNIFEKPLEKNYEDDLTEMFKKLKVKLTNQLGGQRRPPNNNNRQGQLHRVCYKCQQSGHYARECRVNNGQENYRRPNNQNYNKGPNNYNGRPNNYNRPPNYQNNNRGFNAMEYYNDYSDQYDYDNQNYQDNKASFYDQGYDYDDPYYQDNNIAFNHFEQDFYNNGRQTRSIHRISAFQRNIPKYNVLEDMKSIKANATFSQIIDMSPEQRKIYYEGMRRYPQAD